MLDAFDHRFMARALRLARKGLFTAHPNPRVGCVLVKDGQVIGEGFHARAGQEHAEVNALRDAGAAAKDATAYVTLEPCCHRGRTPPCTQALIDAAVKRVVIAIRDPNPHVAGKGLTILSKAEIETHCGLMEVEAGLLNRGFISRMRRGRPWVRLKLATSLDGRTALASGESRWISGEPARRDAHYLRARSSAVMTGSGTVRADNPSLTVRLSPTDLGLEEAPLQPMRIILATDLNIDPRARIFDQPGRHLIFTTAAARDRIRLFERANLEVLTIAARGSDLDLHEIMRVLGEREINEVQVEAGATLSGALLREGLADELVIYMAAVLLGDSGLGLAHLPGMERMADRLCLKIEDVRMIGDDLRITAVPEHNVGR